MDLATLESQMGQTEDRLSAYDANLPSEIESQIKKAGSPLIKESLGVTQDLMGDYLGRYFDTTTMGPGMQGTTAKDLAPTQKLGVMGRELGTMAGQLGSAQGYTDYLGGQINDLYGKAVQAAQLGQQNLADQYSRLFQKYQMAWQEAENAKNRAAAAANAGGFNINPQDYWNEAQSARQPTEGETVRAIKQMANTVASQRGTGAPSYNYGGRNLGSIDDAYNQIMQEASAYGLNLNPEWVWQQLGNEVSPYMTPTPLL